MKGSSGPDTPGRVSRRALRALKPRGLSSAGGFLKTGLKPHALCVSNLITESSRTGLASVQPHALLVWLSGGHHRRGHGDNRHGGQDHLYICCTKLCIDSTRHDNTRVSWLLCRPRAVLTATDCHEITIAADANCVSSVALAWVREQQSHFESLVVER